MASSTEVTVDWLVKSLRVVDMLSLDGSIVEVEGSSVVMLLSNDDICVVVDMLLASVVVAASKKGPYISYSSF